MTITQDRTNRSARTSADDALFVPCRRITGLGTDVLVTGHLPDGTRTGIAFSSPTGVSRAMGASQTWVRLSPGGLRSMLHASGVTHLQMDPDLVAPNPLASPADIPGDPRAGERLQSGATA